MVKSPLRVVPRLLSPIACCIPLVAGCIGERRPQATVDTPAPATPIEASADIDPERIEGNLSHLVKGERSYIRYAASDAQKGARAPKVTIVEFSDFQCPFCGRLAKSLDAVLADRKSDVRVVFKHFPLPMHNNAKDAARATIVARRQGKFWDMHDVLFAHPRDMTPTDIRRYAKDIGLDMVAFDRDFDAAEVRQQVEDDFALGKKLAITSTPSFFINGRKMAGAKPIDEIQAVIDEEISLAQSLIDAGSKPQEVYARILKAIDGDTKGDRD